MTNNNPSRNIPTNDHFDQYINNLVFNHEVNNTESRSVVQSPLPPITSLPPSLPMAPLTQLPTSYLSNYAPVINHPTLQPTPHTSHVSNLASYLLRRRNAVSIPYSIQPVPNSIQPAPNTIPPPAPRFGTKTIGNTPTSFNSSYLSNISSTYQIPSYPKYSQTFNPSNTMGVILGDDYYKLEDYPDDINELDPETFYHEDDFEEDYDLTPKEVEEKTVELQSILDTFNIVLDKDGISLDELDVNFESYIDVMNVKVSYLISVMVENMFWTFNPIEHILWVYLIMACKYEPRAVKYLIKHSSFNKSMLFKEDNIHNSCITHACKSSDSYLVEEFYYNGIITKDILTKHISVAIKTTPLQYSVSNSKTFAFLVEHVPGIEDTLNEDINNKLTLFNLACVNNVDTAKYLLDSKYMNKNYFNKRYNDYTCLILAAIFNPEFLSTLLTSQYCSKELIKHKHCGNVMRFVVLNKPEVFITYLKSDIISEDVFKELLQDGLTNILFFLSRSVYIEDFINSKYFDYSFITHINSHGHTIFNQLIQTNLFGLKCLFDSPYCTKEVFTETNKKSSTSCLSLAASTCKDVRYKAIKIILESSCFSVELLKQQDLYDRNIFMILMEREDFNSEDIGLIDYLFDKCSDIDIIHIMHQIDLSGLNTFAYMCVKAPKLADKFLGCHLFHNSLLESNYTNKNNYNLKCPPMLFPICCLSKDSYLITKILNSDYNSTELMKLTNKQGNNILFEVIIHNRQHLQTLIDCKYMTSELFNSLNSLNNNILNSLIRVMSISSTDITILYNVIDHKWCTKLTVNHQNRYGITPLNEACTKSKTFGKSTSNIVETIINSPHWDSNMYMSYLGNNYFMFACNNKDISLVKTFGEHPLVTKEMFQYREPFTGMSCLSYALANGAHIMRYISNHKFCTLEMFETDIKRWITGISLKHKSMITLFHIAIIKEILKSKYCTKETLHLTTSDKSTLLMIAFTDNNLAFKILDSPMCSTELLTAVNESRENILHHCLSSSILNKELLIKIIDSPHFDISMLKNINSKGDSVLYRMIIKNLNEVAVHILKSFTNEENEKDYLEILTFNNKNGTNLISNMSAFKIVDYLLESPWITPELLKTTTSVGKSCLHTANINLDDFNKILASNKCTPELLNIVDSTGNTFLTTNYKFLKETLASKHCTTELLEYTTKQDLSILIILCMYDVESIPLLLADDRVTSNILIPHEGSTYSPISAALDSENKSFEYILNSDKCTTNIVNCSGSKFGMTMLSEAVANNYYDKVKLLLEDSRDLTVSFTCLNISGKNLIMLGVYATLEIFELLINSKYMKQDMLYVEDDLKHNAVCYAFGTSLEVTKCIVESKFWNDEIMYHRDVDDDFLLAYANNKPKIIKYILNSPKCTQELVNLSNKMGMNCAHYFSVHDDQCMRELLKSNMCNESIINKQDVLKSTCLHKACLHNDLSAYKIIKSKYFTKDLLMKQDIRGQTALMNALISKSDVAMKILKSDLCGPELLLQKDICGDSTFNLAVRYSSEAVRYIMKQSYFKDEFINTILNIRNVDYMTPIMVACKYNPSIVEDILKLDQCTANSLTSGHSDYPSALNIATEYNPLAVKYILNWSKLNWLILNSSSLDIREHIDSDGSLNFIGTACKFNPESLKYALNSEVDLSTFFDLSVTNHPIFIAAKYQPDAVKYILDSKYAIPEFFIIHKDQSSTCIDIAFDFQPKSLWNMINSKSMPTNLLNLIIDEESGYAMLQKISHIYPEVINVQDINKISLTKYDNIVGKEESDSNCIMCCEFKKSIIFACGHLCCVGCAFKLKDCHNCRERIVKKTYLYE
jgi:hypothetical protein